MKYLLTSGRTIKPADYESIKVEYTQEFDTEIQPDINESYKLVEDFVLKKLEAAYIGHEKFMEDLIKKAKQAENTRRKKGITTPPQQKKVNVEPKQTQKNPWSNYKKQPCKPDEEGWAFAKLVPADLVVELDEAYEKTGRLEWTKIGDMEYKLSGTKLNLVNRRPIQ